MKNYKSYYGSLLHRFFDNQLPADQVSELLDWIRARPEEYQEVLELPENQIQLMRYASSAKISEELSRHMHVRLIEALEENAGEAEPVRNKPFSGLHWFRYAAAIVIVLGIVVYLVHIKQEKKTETELINPAIVEKTDVPPGSSKAILTLANGSVINLDMATEGALAQQANSIIVKTDEGRLVYQTPRSGNTKNTGNEKGINTVSTPRGGQYQLRLPDGTDVWLNAASSISYPIAFAEKERRVMIAGEAYFEVAKDSRKPFRVVVYKDSVPHSGGANIPTAEQGGFEIEVLGTHFNVNSYPDEKSSKTTLLEGQVRISHFQASGKDSLPIITGSRSLKAGQQAIVNNQKIQVNNSADIETVMAWKEGIFRLNSADIPSIMRQLSRWYDIEVSYEGEPPSGRISGSVPRNMYLSKVVEAFQMSGINIKVEGSKVIVKQ